jgi:hypothetical protein
LELQNQININKEIVERDSESMRNRVKELEDEIELKNRELQDKVITPLKIRIRYSFNYSKNLRMQLIK